MKNYITINEFAKKIGVDRTTIYRYFKKDYLKYIETPSKKKLIPVSELKKFGADENV